MSDKTFRVQLSSPERQYVKVYKDFLQNEILSANEKLVFIALKSFVGYGSDDGQVYPGIETVCQLTSLSKSTVIRTIRTLTKKGIIQKERRGLTKTNLYVLTDNSTLWKSETVSEMEERSKNRIDGTTEELLEELKRRGFEVITTKKEPSSTLAREDGSRKQLNIVQTTTTQDNNSTAENQVVEKYPRSVLHDIFGFDALDRLDSDDVAAVEQILYDTLNTTKKTIRVNGENKPTNVVKGKLLKLDYNDIDYVIRQYNDQRERIKNPQAYILTQLYNAKEQNHLDLKNQGHVNGDF